MYLFESPLSISGAHTWEWHCGVIANKKWPSCFWFPRWWRGDRWPSEEVQGFLSLLDPKRGHSLCVGRRDHGPSGQLSISEDAVQIAFFSFHPQSWWNGHCVTSCTGLSTTVAPSLESQVDWDCGTKGKGPSRCCRVLRLAPERSLCSLSNVVPASSLQSLRF